MSVDILDRVYDAYTGEMGQQFMRETQRRIHWMCESVRGGSVLDVGCSQGLVPILLGREGKSVVGIDMNPTSIRTADERLVAEQVSVRKRVSFVEGDFVAHSFDGVTFDTIVMGEVLEHLLEPARFIDTAARLLPAGGRLVITVPFGINDHVDHKHTFYLLEPLRLIAEQFELVELVILGKWLGLVGSRRAEPLSETSASWSDQQIRTLERAFNHVERELVDELVALRGRLDDANVKYRASNEELTRLKREVAHHETERKSAERARALLEQQLTQAASSQPNGGAAAELDALRGQVGEQRENAHGRELNITRLEERLAHAAQLRSLELGVRDSEITRLHKERDEVMSQLRASEARSTAADELTRGMAERHDAERQRLQSALDDHAQQARTSAQHAASLQAQLLQHFEELEASRRSLAARTAELSSFDQRLTLLQEELRAERSEASALRGELAEARASLQQGLSAKRELDEAGKRVRQLEAAAEARDNASSERERVLFQRRLEEAEKSQAVQRQALERELETQRAALRETERKAEQARQQLATTTQSERRATRQLEQERRNRTAAERKVVQTRNTLSFQLGYELIHGFKSRQRLLTLPGTLWSLQKEANRRRAERAARDVPVVTTQHPAPAPPTPSGGEPANAMPAAAPLPPPPERPAHSTSAPTLIAAAPIKAAPRRVPRLDAGVSKLRVACIHDEFTFASYAPECNLLPLTPTRFAEELERFEPELLFVESAWRGKDDSWGKKISHRGHELLEVVEWCVTRGVPTVFWNKEDPVHFGTFVNTAKLFDYVFTTDFDCIARYKQALGHDRVYLLPFACQPAQHNPIEKYERKDAICFAGAYYARYPERQQDLASFALNFVDAPRLEIFDRNYGKNDPNYAFPEEYRPFIVGTLRFDEIDRAYKGYRYALNLNSIKESQTMFARRLYELLGSNTITVSNFSRGIRLLFGDLVIATDRGERAREKLLELCADESRARRFRLAGLRKVLGEHTYGQRLRFVASRVWERDVPDDLPLVVVLAKVSNAEEQRSVLAAFERQSYPHKKLVLVAPNQPTLASPRLGEHVRSYSAEKAATLWLSDVAPDSSYVAAFAPNDYHGPSYLLDLALTTKYAKAAAIGKLARYVSRAAGALVLERDGTQYRRAPSLPVKAALVRRDLVAAASLGEWLESVATRQFEHEDCLAVDEFNYCEDGSSLASKLLEGVDDLAGLDTGLTLVELLKCTPGPAVAARVQPEQRAISGERLASIFKPPAGKPVLLSLENAALLVQSALPDETHEYIYANQMWQLGELGFPHSDRFHLEATPGLNLHMAILFLDENKQRLAHKLCPAGRNETATPPAGAVYAQLGLRVYGSGTAKISGFLLDHVAETPERIFGRSDYLLLTNHYPADHDLYRNGFVHRRVVDYRRQGTRVDVFRHRRGEKLGHREFDGVDVISGGDDALTALLRSNDYKAVLVHFLDSAMWQVLRQEGKQARPLLWLHGAEIQAWHRRNFKDSSDIELEAAKVKSAKRDDFWRRLLQELPADGKLVFVSRHFAEQTLSDLGLPRDQQRCTVIHNLIDGALFEYHPKSVEQRKRVLSIRPFVSRKYGNDLSVAAILELSKKPYFEQLFFHLIGDGPLFDAIVAPLRGLPNVRLDKGFITQREIAQLHRDYGIFLCPTRDDTQGVSRDEAMASGLVPVTSRVAAIPEFVDDDCAVIAEPESHLGLADGIARLYEDPQYFRRLSERAAARVRGQSGAEQTTARELELILGRTP